jgi:hypothetical protein
VQDAASLDVVILGALVIAHLLARKDKPAHARPHNANSDEGRVPCKLSVDKSQGGQRLSSKWRAQKHAGALGASACLHHFCGLQEQATRSRFLPKCRGGSITSAAQAGCPPSPPHAP